MPIDNTYAGGATVTVLGNTGSLVKITDGYSWVLARWNTQANGSGTDYTPGVSTFAIGTANVNLYAKWPYAPGPSGGLIFYDKGSYSGTPSWRYLEAAPSDQSTGIQWGGQFTETGATATAIGTGQANTTTIVGILGTGISYAARTCDELVLGGYSDWFLPSKDELNKMYTELKLYGVGGFGDTYYSSSEYNSMNAWYQSFGSGNQNYVAKSTTYSVRAARAF